MSYGWPDFIGNLGVLAVLGAYFLLQTGRLPVDAIAYSLLNALGAVLISISLVYSIRIYKFNSAKIDDIEKEPAYKRQGVNLEDAQHSSETKASRTSVATDDNDDIQLRSNNSFLHDNVD